ncbi:PTS sugar transporter subunit IIA [Propionibacterium freudenreichii]|uniref:PTS sugar transporter subunit IIA n=1 Tax=Propionibacterium freudenreichii TaxID=1744 RepID=UPI000AC6DFDE|nr:PTS sugar transporter subunit IIA [Propionibacterium freudenreichii]MCT3017574.1 PTS sugar transporter subunit IIA [Propionibacterium freudenreichii]MDK9641629.1 PTS sugar transporter subunit IIA [Propionibacterium freudenreichii]
MTQMIGASGGDGVKPTGGEELASPDAVWLGLESDSAHALLSDMSQRLLDAGYVRPGYSESLWRREERYPTGLPVSGGVAIPHTEPELVRRGVVAIASLARPVAFEEMGGSGTVPVSVVFLLGLDRAEGHVDLLQRLIKAIQKKGIVEEIRSADDPEDVAARVNALLRSPGA